MQPQPVIWQDFYGSPKLNSRNETNRRRTSFIQSSGWNSHMELWHEFPLWLELLPGRTMQWNQPWPRRHVLSREAIPWPGMSPRKAVKPQFMSNFIYNPFLTCLFYLDLLVDTWCRSQTAWTYLFQVNMHGRAQTLWDLWEASTTEHLLNSLQRSGVSASDEVTFR